MNELRDGNDSTNKKKPNPILDLLTGILISIMTYALMMGGLSLPGSSKPVIAIIELLILAAFGLITVKFFRTGHTLAASIMLVMIAPALFALLLLGACIASGPLFG